MLHRERRRGQGEYHLDYPKGASRAPRRARADEGHELG